jgi:N-methylhydantoinase B/oxoprolinase/acetone carboxylase alpha subunit
MTVLTDRIGLTLLYQQCVNICDEMAFAMMRTAYSPIFSEGLDFSTMLLDASGELLAMAGINPAMLGASLYAPKWIVQEIGAENFAEGDVFVHNDPYRGGSHIPEHLVVTPVFVGGEIRGFVGAIAHWVEVGGMAPGSFAATANDVYQEGLRLPPVRLFAGGEPVRDVWRIVLANHRTPNSTWGDMNAMVGALTVGVRRLRRLFEERGLDYVLSSYPRLHDYADGWMREQIRALPNGIYHGADCMEDDGVSERAYWIRLRLIVDDDSLIFDFSDSDEQAGGPINSPYVVTVSGALNGFLMLLSPEERIPVNAGTARSVHVVAPPGTVANVRHPGACVAGQTEVQNRILELVGRTLAGIVPERAAAAAGGTSMNFLIGGVDPRSGDYYAHYHFEGNGWGGRATSDGNDAQIVPHGNCRNTPVEIFETRWPWRHEEYRLNSDTAGAGRRRGGLGIRRTLTFVGDAVRVSALADRMKIAPPGIFGGHDGHPSGLEIRRAGEPGFRTFKDAFGTVSPSKFVNVHLHRGDQVRITSPSGAGYGDPLERDPALVAADVAEGYVSVESARADYRVVLADDGTVDTAATDRLREDAR